MQVSVERRCRARRHVGGLEEMFRQCDVQLILAEEDRDAYIEDITPLGVRFVLCQSGNGLARGDRVFIRGCAFHDLIGFLSSSTGTVKWARDGHCGVQFDHPLVLDDPDLAAIIDFSCQM